MNLFTKHSFKSIVLRYYKKNCETYKFSLKLEKYKFVLKTNLM